MVLHSHFQENLPKCDNHIKGSVPFLPIASPFFFLFCFFLFLLFFFFFFSFILHSKWGSYLAVCSLIEKAKMQQAPTGKRLVSSIGLWLYLIWGWICCKKCFELAAYDSMYESHCVRSMCNSPWPSFQPGCSQQNLGLATKLSHSLPLSSGGVFKFYLLYTHTSYKIYLFRQHEEKKTVWTPENCSKSDEFTRICHFGVWTKKIRYSFKKIIQQWLSRQISSLVVRQNYSKLYSISPS